MLSGRYHFLRRDIDSIKAGNRTFQLYIHMILPPASESNRQLLPLIENRPKHSFKKQKQNCQNKEEHIHLLFPMHRQFTRPGYALPFVILACPHKSRNRFLRLPFHNCCSAKAPLLNPIRGARERQSASQQMKQPQSRIRPHAPHLPGNLPAHKRIPRNIFPLENAQRYWLNVPNSSRTCLKHFHA